MPAVITIKPAYPTLEFRVLDVCTRVLVLAGVGSGVGEGAGRGGTTVGKRVQRIHAPL